MPVMVLKKVIMSDPLLSANAASLIKYYKQLKFSAPHWPVSVTNIHVSVFKLPTCEAF